MGRSLGGPMAGGAAENRFGPITDRTRHRIRAPSAAADNVAVFFGEDIFVAIGSILLIMGFLEQNGVRVEPAHLALWAIPTAIAAWIIHNVRLVLLDRSLEPELAAARAAAATTEPTGSRPGTSTGPWARRPRP